jgi:hypothetical protein
MGDYLKMFMIGTRNPHLGRTADLSLPTFFKSNTWRQKVFTSLFLTNIATTSTLQLHNFWLIVYHILKGSYECKIYYCSYAYVKLVIRGRWGREWQWWRLLDDASIFLHSYHLWLLDLFGPYHYDLFLPLATLEIERGSCMSWRRWRRWARRSKLH